jgi:hypothetical protein
MNEDDISIYGFSDNKPSHASLRAKERYGIELTDEDLQNMSDICQMKKCCRDYQKALGFGKHHIHVSYKDIWWNVIWCSETNIICTILHPKHNPMPKSS